MPAKKDPSLTDEERARRIRELAEQAGTGNDAEAFDRTFGAVLTPEQNGLRRGPGEKRSTPRN
jgi:hypothetical protein